MKRTSSAVENEFVFDSWKNGNGFSDVAKTLDSKPGTHFTILRGSGGMKPDVRKRASSHLMLSEREKYTLDSLPKKYPSYCALSKSLAF